MRKKPTCPKEWILSFRRVINGINMYGNDKSGFSLIELMIYVGIFAVSAVFLVSILTVVTQIQLRNNSVHELNQQISFVRSTVERFVQTSSLIDMTTAVSTSTIKLRMSSSTDDTVLIYASNSVLYIATTDSSGNTSTKPLTDSNVTVDNFSATKYQTPSGFSLVQIDMALSYNATNPKAQASRSLKTAIARISAAEFDSSVYPNVTDNFDLGTASKNWKNAYYSGVVGIGATSFSPGYKMVISGGDIGVRDVSTGVVVKTPDGSACYRLGVTNTGGVTTTLVGTCP